MARHSSGKGSAGKGNAGKTSAGKASGRQPRQAFDKRAADDDSPVATPASAVEPEVDEAAEADLDEAGVAAADADADLADEDVDDVEDEDDIDLDEEADEESGAPARTPESDAFWSEVRVDPVEIALPQGVGYTLRAYRSSKTVTFSDIDRDEEDFTVLDRYSPEDEDEDDLDELEDDELEDDELDEDDEDDEEEDDDDDLDSDEDEEEEDEDEDEEEEDEEDEEIPVFLGRNGRLYLFRSPEALVSFVRSDAPHELAQLDTWRDLRERISVVDVVPQSADRYELDLVVENLRGGHDAWDPELLIRAGEVARDLAYALRLEAVLGALSSGSPLDDLDDALRSSTEGGIGGFFGRRKLRKIGAQQAALAWRSIIGKISAAADWRE